MSLQLGFVTRGVQKHILREKISRSDVQKIQKRRGLVWKVSYMERSHDGVVSNDFPVERMAREVAHFLLDKM